ncbi:MAG: J domain-containing protein [Chloroflexi bacterium]|nr:J domain-containing protein [Chloroflexota bacterium]
MKEYYDILGVPQGASQDDIKKAYRRLAFQHHPDTNPGREKEAEAKFKEISEAFGVLGDEVKRQQYDQARSGAFAGAGNGSGGPGYSQQDIFRDIFSNPVVFNDLNRMFSQAGLRFDQDFLNRLFFSGSGYIFQFSFSPSGVKRNAHAYGSGADTATAYQDEIAAKARRPGFFERFFNRILFKVTTWAMRRAFGLILPSGDSPDLYRELRVTRLEAAAGIEKEITYKRGRKAKKLMVKVPAGIQSGTRIRLSGMGLTKKGRTGDLYLEVKVKD